MLTDPTPSPPSTPDPPGDNDRWSWLKILSAVLIGLALYGVLCFLTLNFLGPIIVVVSLLFGAVALHYMIWGWWLGDVIRRAAQEEEQQSQS